MDLKVYKATVTGKFRGFWKFYILQSVLASAALFLTIVFVGREASVVIASMGATAFICFALPKSSSAQSRNVIGGHLIGLLIGLLFSSVSWPYIVEFSAAGGVAIFLMVALDMEHPPAVGTTLAVQMHQVDLRVASAILIGALVISQIRYYLRRYLRDLV